MRQSSFIEDCRIRRKDFAEALRPALIRRRAAHAVAAQRHVVDVPAESFNIGVAGEVEANGDGLAGIARQVNDDLLELAETAIDAGGPAGKRAGGEFPDRAVVAALDDL